MPRRKKRTSKLPIALLSQDEGPLGEEIPAPMPPRIAGPFAQALATPGSDFLTPALLGDATQR